VLVTLCATKACIWGWLLMRNYDENSINARRHAQYVTLKQQQEGCKGKEGTSDKDDGIRWGGY